MKKNFLRAFYCYLIFSISLAYTETEESQTIIKEPQEERMDLGQLFRHYGSDKDRTGFTSVYHCLFDQLREKPLRILEIGIGTMIPDVHSSMVGYACPGYSPGGSLRAWRDYFTNSTIYGVDVQEDTQFSNEKRISTYLCDSMDQQKVEEFIRKLGNIKFDIIIDDGSHLPDDQLKTLSNFYPHLNEGGIYAIEDIYSGSPLSNNPKLISQSCHGDPFFFVGLQNNLCIIYKKKLCRDTNNYRY